MQRGPSPEYSHARPSHCSASRWYFPTRGSYFPAKLAGVKKLIFAIVAAAIVLALAIWGNRIAGRALDAQLAPLLTDELGLPVALAPIKANLLQLKAGSARLVMGPEDNPAVTASDIVVRLSLDALLQREIRLEFAGAEQVMVAPSKWPSSDSPLPDNYHFLDQWLPTTLFAETLRLSIDEDSEYTFAGLNWRRDANGSFKLSWARPARAQADPDGAGHPTASQDDGGMEFEATVQSLYDLLALKPTSLAVVASVPGDPPATATLDAHIAPGDNAAYTISATIDGPGINGSVVASAVQAWSLPDTSTTHLQQLQIDEVLALARTLAPRGELREDSSRLDEPVPTLALFPHHGEVRIDVLRWGDELGEDSAFDFTMTPEGIDVTGLRSRGPTGQVTGGIKLAQSSKGWQIELEAKMTALDEQGGIGDQFMLSDWLWQTGGATIRGSGATWGELINTLEGQVNLAGHHRGDEKTPVTFATRLDNQPDVFSLESVSLALGEGHFKGSATLTSTLPRLLTVNLTGEQLALDFLFDAEPDDTAPGIALPTFLTAFRDIDVEATLDVKGLTAPGVQIAETSAHLMRNARGGTLKASATGVDKGALTISLRSDVAAGQPSSVQLQTSFSDFNIPALFQQQGQLHSRSTGTLSFSSRGHGTRDVFSKMRGNANIKTRVRADDDWQRPAREGEELDISGDARLVLDGDRITGVQLSNLQLLSVEQHLNGEVSLVDGRKPWLVADLTSRQLDIEGLLELLPASKEEADEKNILDSLRGMGAVRLSLDVDSLIAEDMPLSSALLTVESAQDRFNILHLDFTRRGSELKSTGALYWKDGVAHLEAEASLDKVNLDQFLISDPNRRHIPVSGSAQITSSGATVAELAANVTGHVSLDASDALDQQVPGNRRHLDLQATRLPNGMRAQIQSLQWGETELAGQLEYHKTTPPRLEVEITAGTLSLLPWENAFGKNGTTPAPGDTADRTRKAVARALQAPFRLLAPNTATPPGERIFSSTPINFTPLGQVEARFSGSLDALDSTVLTAQDITFNGTLKDSVLALELASATFNGGSGELDLAIDPTTEPPTMQLTSTYAGVKGLADDTAYPRSGFVSVQTRGHSAAELAAAASGLLYVELGEGPFDYINTTFFTADLASTVFQTLIPGIERKKTRIECGVAVGLLQDGMGVTPYGFSVRTNQANLLGRLQVNLRDETLELTFDSRSRKGVGLSVGNVFSSTVRVVGPLSNPRVQPRATGLAWRSWAAVMTAGLSVVGESVLKRVLASENPCKSTRQIIDRELCPNNALAQSSALVCPNSQAQAGI